MGRRSGGLLGRDFVLLWQGQLVSQLGNQAFLVATVSWTLETTGSPALMGLLLVASTLPAVVFGPIAGALADRHSRKALIVMADLSRGLSHLALAALFTLAPDASRTIVGMLLVVGFGSGLAGALLTSALAAALPDIVPPPRLAAANSLYQMSGQTAALAGQAAGGLAYVAVGVAGLVLFDGITFLASAGCAALARVPAGSPGTEGRVPLRAYLRDVREGIAWIWLRPSLRSLILAFTLVNFLFTPVFVLLPVYVRDVLDRGTEWYGFLLAAAGAGALLGASLAPRALRLRVHPTWLVVGIGACTAGLAAARSPSLALGLLAGLGLLSAVLNVAVMTRLQTAVPGEMRGRVLAVAIALAGAAVPAGLALGGLAGEIARPALAVVIAACGAGIAMSGRLLKG